jgi:hypothetical protein
MLHITYVVDNAMHAFPRGRGQDWHSSRSGQGVHSLVGLPDTDTEPEIMGTQALGVVTRVNFCWLPLYLESPKVDGRSGVEPGDWLIWKRGSVTQECSHL